MKYIITLCFLFPFVINAQQFVNTGGIIISKGSFIKIDGTLTNQDGAIIYSLGEVHVSGDLLNHDPRFGFSSLTHKVVLNGNNQLIGGSKPWHFATLELSSGVKTLNQPIAVGYGGVGLGYQLDLGNAVLKLNSQTLDLRGSYMAIKRNTGLIESETHSGIGLGKVNWETVNTAAGTKFTFPFGNSAGNHYLPVSVTLQQQALSNSILSAATYPTSAALTPNNRPLPSTINHFNNSSGQDMSAKALDRFWLIDGINYAPGSRANIELDYLDEEWNATANSSNNINEASLKPVSWTGSAWGLVTGSVNSSDNRITLNDHLLSQANLTAWETGITLPVKLISFKGSCDNYKARFDWTTAEEIDVDQFVIQQSDDGVSWNDEHHQQANNTGMIQSQYHVVLNTRAEGYYRLKMIDIDGKFSFSNTVPVNCASIQVASITPNPTNGAIKISLNANNSYKANITVTDMSGKRIEQRAIAVNTGSNFYNVDLSNFPAGTYHVQVTKGTEMILSKLVVKRN